MQKMLCRSSEKFKKRLGQNCAFEIAHARFAQANLRMLILRIEICAFKFAHAMFAQVKNAYAKIAHAKIAHWLFYHVFVNPGKSDHRKSCRSDHDLQLFL